MDKYLRPNISVFIIFHHIKHDLTCDTVDWADLATLDLSNFDAPNGKEELASQLFNAIQNIGRLHSHGDSKLLVDVLD